MFIDYKLKVAEAYDQGLHLEEAYTKEFGNYQDQLARSYIYEDKVNDAMAEEAYRHGLEEINANHIRPVTEGHETGICKPVQVGRSIHVWNIEIFRDDGKLSCVSRLTCAIKDTNL